MTVMFWDLLSLKIETLYFFETVASNDESASSSSPVKTFYHIIHSAYLSTASFVVNLSTKRM